MNNVTVEKEMELSDATVEGPMKLSLWVDEFIRNDKTKAYYKSALRNWVRCMYGPGCVDDYRMTYSISGGEESMELMRAEQNRRTSEIDSMVMKYVDDDRDLAKDMREFVRWMEKEIYANTSIHMFCCMVKLYLADIGGEYELSKRDWRRVKRLLPPNLPLTQDEAPTKEQIRMLLHHMGTHGRAWTLFLSSSGARQGEAIQLRMSDLNMDADPPYTDIRPKYTKKGVGGRRVFFNYECRGALLEWFKNKDTRRKKTPGGELFPKDMVFGFDIGTAQYLWRSALAKAGLAKRDPNTKKRLHVYHMHTLRKFFRTEMGLAGVPDVVVHGWMGHKGYQSEAYDRVGKKKAGEIYKEYMDAVTIYERELSTKLKEDLTETKRLAEKAISDKMELEVFIDFMGEEFDIPKGLDVKKKFHEIITRTVSRRQEMLELENRGLELEKRVSELEEKMGG